MTLVNDQTVIRDPHPQMVRLLDHDGRLVDNSARAANFPAAITVGLYRWMVFGRIFDQRCFNLQRQGKLTTYAPLAGQEAAQAGCGLALQSDDWVFPTYRDGLTLMMHGLPPEYVIYVFRGHPLGGAIPPNVNVFPIQIGIAEQIPHAVGVALGMKMRHQTAAAVAMFGDGATSEGEFHEAANFAAVTNAPAILFCQNNGYAISMPRARQTASETIAQKAIAYGMPGVLVDGNDALAVYSVLNEALTRARSGGGPTLIEAVTYRLGPHTTSDDPTRYRSDDELALWQTQRDPLTRLRAYLESQGLWNDDQQAALEEESRDRVATAVRIAIEAPVPAPDSIFDHIFAEPTPTLNAQRQELRDYLIARGLLPDQHS